MPKLRHALGCLMRRKSLENCRSFYPRPSFIGQDLCNMTTGEIELLSYFPARHQPVHLADFTDHGRRKLCSVSSMATLIALIFFPSSPPEMIDVHAPSIPAGMCCLVFARRSLTESLLTE